MSEAEAVKKSILEMAKSVAHVQDEVEKFSPPDKGDGDPAEAILNIRKAAKAMDAEATKLSVAFFSDPVSFEMCRPLIDGFCTLTVVVCAHWCDNAPEPQGYCLSHRVLPSHRHDY
eukprot:m.40768 g.40768  ORF g.40768 m.40768 type:complete len:116 (-) comp8127_c0_seq1:140-487(-)